MLYLIYCAVVTLMVLQAFRAADRKSITVLGAQRIIENFHMCAAVIAVAAIVATAALAIPNYIEPVVMHHLKMQPASEYIYFFEVLSYVLVLIITGKCRKKSSESIATELFYGIITMLLLAILWRANTLVSLFVILEAAWISMCALVISCSKAHISHDGVYYQEGFAYRIAQILRADIIKVAVMFVYLQITYILTTSRSAMCLFRSLLGDVCKPGLLYFIITAALLLWLTYKKISNWNSSFGATSQINVLSTADAVPYISLYYLNIISYYLMLLFYLVVKTPLCALVIALTTVIAIVCCRRKGQKLYNFYVTSTILNQAVLLAAFSILGNSAALIQPEPLIGVKIFRIKNK